MKTGKILVSLAVILALALAAFAASTASAADRAWTCKPVASVAKGFSDAHCVTSAANTNHEHTLIEEPNTPLAATNEKTASATTASSPAQLKGHIAGVETAVTCTTVSGSGHLTNGATSVSGTGKITYSGCTVTLPAGKGCKVSGTIETKELKATTEGTTGTRLKFEPNSGTEFATIPISGCEKERPPAGSYVVEGSLEAPVTGATTTAGHTEITGQGTLLFGGTAAGLEGAITISMKEPSGEPGNAIALTP